jgi:uncharacterized membrane protein YedE/YeeE
MMPLDLNTLVGHVGQNLFYVLTGVGFGFALEQAGFGNSRNLAAQFYLKDMRVLKVMFTAILTAMLLLFWSGAVGLVDVGRVFVNPTYLWPGILGGLIFGFGFVIGGYCPGTALVSVSTLKLDGLFFVLGLGAGMVAFGETIPWYQTFFDTSGFYGDLTLMQVFGLPTGVVVLGVVLMALGMFYGAEKIEAFFAGRRSTRSMQ